MPNIKKHTLSFEVPWRQAQAKDRQDILQCLKLAKNAHAGISKYAVGAMIYSQSGGRYTGVNFEDGAGGVICAERAALLSAVTAGDAQIARVVVAGIYASRPVSHSHACPPCGRCRQALLAVLNDQDDVIDAEVIYFDPSNRTVHKTSVRELFPQPFTGDRMVLGNWNAKLGLIIDGLTRRLKGV